MTGPKKKGTSTHLSGPYDAKIFSLLSRIAGNAARNTYDGDAFPPLSDSDRELYKTSIALCRKRINDGPSYLATLKNLRAQIRQSNLQLRAERNIPQRIALGRRVETLTSVCARLEEDSASAARVAAIEWHLKQMEKNNVPLEKTLSVLRYFNIEEIP